MNKLFFYLYRKGIGFISLLPVLTICFFGLGCGKKAPPRLPAPIKTEKIKIIKSQAEKGKIDISWIYDKNKFLASYFEIYRSKEDGNFEKIATVNVKEKSKNGEEALEKQVFQYGDTKNLVDGNWYHYVIAGINDKGELSGISDAVDVYFSKELPPVRNLRGELEKNYVKLLWDSPFDSLEKDKKEVAGYNIYRRKAGNKLFKAVNSALIRKKSFIDMKIRKDMVYEYVVKAVDNFFPPWHEGAASETVIIDTADNEAPEPPMNVKAVGGVDRISLKWEKSISEDVAGYRVYRSESEDGEFVLQNKELLRNEYYDDLNVTAGVRYFYRVSVVDDSENSNESELSEIVSAEPL
ncbi:MAG: hypothetical protein D6734_05015 [Candidatus Schekmanbacteria bacterium]|nr:MAG: hypothetical protein D6734_05015 [Candidatus Schekmanbacteria bacterium]